MRSFLPFFLFAAGCVGSEGGVVESPRCDRFVGADMKAVQSERFPVDILPIVYRGVRCSIVSFPWHTFGESNSAVEHFLEVSDSQDVMIRVDLFNATCVRNRNCAEGDLFRGVSVRELNEFLERELVYVTLSLRERVREIRSWVEGLPPRALPVISLALEDDFSDAAAEVVLGIVQEEWPGVLTVSNPVRGVRKVGTTYHETHGLYPNCSEAEFISQDGSISRGEPGTGDSDFLDASRACVASMLWRPEWQGRGRDGEGRVTPADKAPRERDIHITAAEAEALNEALRAAQ